MYIISMVSLSKWLAVVVAVAHTLQVTTCSAEDAREHAFINYSEVSRAQEELLPSEVAAVALVSSYGEARLVLRRDWAPKACEAVARMAAGSLRACPGCTLYRHEPVPQNWGVNDYMGPPYSLLQGGLPGLDTKVALENTDQRPVLRGYAAFISGTADFFIGTADHKEWGGAFTVFGQVLPADMDAVVARIPTSPYRNSTDQYNITTRWLLAPVPFKLGPLRLADLPSEAAEGQQQQQQATAASRR